MSRPISSSRSSTSARHVVAAPDLGGATRGSRSPRQRALEDPVLELHQRPRALGVLVQHALDRLERHEALLLELLDQPDPLDELRRVPGHVARGLHRLGQQALAQVVLDRARAHAAGLGQLAHPEQAVARSCHERAAARRPPGPATAPDSSSAAISSSRVAQLGQHLGGVLAERRARPRGIGRACGSSSPACPAAARASRAPGWSTSTTISRARTSSESSASSRSSTGSRQQSCSEANCLPLVARALDEDALHLGVGRRSRADRTAARSGPRAPRRGTTPARTWARARPGSPSRRCTA